VLYLVHHGDAVGPDVDPMRPLSDRGRAQVEALAGEAGSRGAKPDIIWHSGKLRARQTAEFYWRYCNPLASISAVRGLQPTDPTGWILDAIVGETRSIMLAGHFPHLPRLLGRLVSGDPEAPPSSFPLNGIVVVDALDVKWIEKWRLSPPGGSW
jgi:phosphohistidine phosphatase